MKTRRSLPLILTLFLCLCIIGCVTPPQKSAAYHAKAYFSPEGHIRNQIINTIDSSRVSIDIAIFDLTSKDIKVVLTNAKNRGVKIRIIADSRQYKGPHSVIQSLVDSGFDVKISHGKNGGIMHNKFAIFDKKLLLTGSYNWTENAEQFNYENAIFLSDSEVIRLSRFFSDSDLKQQV